MSAMSDYLENKVLDHVLSTSAFAMPSAVYLGLATASFNDDASGTELTGNNYSRVGDIPFDAASGGVADNTNNIEFAAATGSWGTVTSWALFDASTGGNMLIHGSLTTSKTISTGDILRISAGDLDVTAA